MGGGGAPRARSNLNESGKSKRSTVISIRPYARCNTRTVAKRSGDLLVYLYQLILSVGRTVRPIFIMIELYGVIKVSPRGRLAVCPSSEIECAVTTFDEVRD